ncbi:uncharacterized protein [Ptychodera flava]|uniref:uncharacterized protein isoform X1 n=1 Tax=Ptychodera flava TaxID=63121 RepID=UPI00396AA907
MQFSKRTIINRTDLGELIDIGKMLSSRKIISFITLIGAVTLLHVPGSGCNEEIPSSSSGGFRPKFEMSADDQSKYDGGRTQLLTLQEYSKNQRYGKCWTNALTRIQDGCRRLTEDEQSRLALAFTNCHLQKMGIDENYECTYEQRFSDCVTGISERAYIAYTEFYTHTQNICFFLQNQIWQEKTELTVSRLVDSSEDVAERLEEAGKMQEKMIERQNASLKNQEEILENEKRLQEFMNSQMAEVQAEFSEMKATAQEHKLLFSEAFEKVAALQKLVMVEFTGFYSLLFYALGALITYLLTSTARTSGARIWMFLVLFINILLERVIARSTDDSDLVYSRMWLSRQIFCGLALLVLVVTAIRYKDFAKINNSLLHDIRRQNSELKNFLLSISHSSLPLPSNTLPLPMEGISSGLLQQSKLLNQLPAGCDMSDSALETEDKLPAITQGDEFSAGSDSDTSFVTVAAGGKPSPGKKAPKLEKIAEPLQEELGTRSRTHAVHDVSSNSSFKRSSVRTRIVETSLITDIGNASEQAPAERRPRGRPKGKKNRKSIPLTPEQDLNTSRYNLRQRSRTNTPASSTRSSPSRNTPSATFQSPAVQEMVKQAVELNNRIRRLNKVPNVVTRKERPDFFSSDED